MKFAVEPCRGALFPAAATLHAIALTSLFPIVVAGGPLHAENTYTSSCQVGLVGTNGFLDETECLYLDSTFTHTYNSYVSDPDASERTKEVLDAVVSSQSYTEDEGIAGTRRGRRKLGKTTEGMATLSTCTVCEDDREASLFEDGLSRRLRSSSLLVSFEEKLCEALQNSTFDAFQKLKDCKVSCGELRPVSVKEWMKMWYTNQENGAHEEEEEMVLTAALPPDDTAAPAATTTVALAAALPPDDTSAPEVVVESNQKGGNGK